MIHLKPVYLDFPVFLSSIKLLMVHVDPTLRDLTYFMIAYLS